jgi:hypothetical protein
MYEHISTVVNLKLAGVDPEAFHWPNQLALEMSPITGQYISIIRKAPNELLHRHR